MNASSCLVIGADIRGVTYAYSGRGAYRPTPTELTLTPIISVAVIIVLITTLMTSPFIRLSIQ